MTSVTASSSAAEVQLQLDTQPGTRWTMSDEEGQGHDEGAVAVDGRAGSLKDDAPPSPPIYPPPHTDQEATQGLEGRRRVLRHDGPGDTELPPPLSSSGSSSYASSTMRPSYTPTPTPHTTTHRRTRDFYLLPIPEWRQFREDKPFVFSPFINYLFAFAATFTVANLYYCQPLLVQFSESFGVSYGAATHVPTLLQGGYAFGLLFISPLGDIVRRRALLLALCAASCLLSIGLIVTKSFVAFQVLNFLIGVVTVCPQILIPLAADLAPAARRAQSMGIVLSGLMFGVLTARVLGGIIAEFSSWRNVYAMAVATQAVVWASLYFALPDYPPKNPDLKYWEIYSTMLKYIVTNPVLVQCSLLSGVGSAIFAGFWVTLTFLLSAQPYGYNTFVIGLFGLVGMVGVCASFFVGRLVDRLVPWVGALLGNFLLLCHSVLLLGGSQASVAVVVIAIIFLDVGQPLQQVSNQSRIYSTNPAGGSRLNAVYLITLFCGQLIGSSLCTKVFLEYGPRPFYGLCCGLCGFNFCNLMIRGPLKSNKKWLGWGTRGDWTLKKRKAPSVATKDEESASREKGQEEGKTVEGVEDEADGKMRGSDKMEVLDR